MQPIRPYPSKAMRSTAILAVLFALCLARSMAIRVVTLANYGRSHYEVLAKLGEELERRGHEVLHIVGPEATFALGKPNVKAFKMSENEKVFMANHARRMAEMTHLSLLKRLDASLLELQQSSKLYCDRLLGDQAMMDEVNRADIIIGDSLYMCSALVADRFNLPHVTIVMATLGTPTLHFFGVSPYPAYVPTFLAGLPENMGLKLRIANFAMFIGSHFAKKALSAPYVTLKAKYKITPEKTISQTLAKVDLVLLTKFLVLDYPQPIPPFVKEVGNFMAQPARPLPAEMESFAQRSGDEGVILVSFGSMLDTIDDHVVQEMARAFSEFPQTVIWRVPGREGITLGSNIKAVNWLPQNDILGHVKTKLFIMHGGANGLAEAAYHGVPMVCSPVYGDQFDNCQIIIRAGIGEMLDFAHAPVSDMVSVMRKVLNEKKYRDNSARVSRIIKARPRTPVQEAADHVEYVQAVGNMEHLKPRGMQLPFYQVYLLDVMAVLGIAGVVIIAIIIGVIWVVIRACRKDPKKKTS